METLVLSFWDGTQDRQRQSVTQSHVLAVHDRTTTGNQLKKEQQNAKSAGVGQPKAPDRSISMTAAEKKTTAMCG
jgi:hypothetical protein